MSSNEQCHFELALVKVRRIRNRWSGCVPGVAARQHVPAPREAGTSPAAIGAPAGPWGQGSRRAMGGPTTSTGPCIPRRCGEGGPVGAAG